MGNEDFMLSQLKYENNMLSQLKSKIILMAVEEIKNECKRNNCMSCRFIKWDNDNEKYICAFQDVPDKWDLSYLERR